MDYGIGRNPDYYTELDTLTGNSARIVQPQIPAGCKASTVPSKIQE